MPPSGDATFELGLVAVKDPVLSKDPSAAKKNARAVCTELEKTTNLLDVAKVVHTMYPSLSQYGQGQFIGLSVMGYCQDQRAKVGM